MSLVYIYFTPLLIVFVYPQNDLNIVFEKVALVYGWGTFLIGIILFINILFYGTIILGRMGGLNSQSKNTSKVLDDVFGKSKKLFMRR